MVRSRWVWGAAAALLLIMVFEVALSTRQTSASWDEGDHIFSGYMNWKNREYSLNPEHPPLVKLIAALPLLPLDLKVAPREGRFFKSEAYFGGRELLYRNDPRYGGHYTADSLLFRAHMAVFIFALLLASLLFFAGREMFGASAGLVAMTLFVFDPTVLTNAPFVTTDSAAACFFFASVYAFYRYIKAPSWQRLVLCGVTFGAALVSKHSAVLLLPILLLLASGELAGRWYASRREQRTWSPSDAARIGAAMAAMAAIAVFVLWGVYSFRYAMHPIGATLPPLEARSSRLSPVMSETILFCTHHHLLPESYLYGLVDVQRVGAWMPSYIFGKLYAHGQWFYFPVALSLKWSIGVLGLLLLAIYAFATGRVHKPREVFFLALPGLFYLAVAMAGPLNIGVRHVLPVFPLAFALAGGGAWSLMQQRRVWLYPVAALLLWHAVDSLRMFPNYMPYANVLWGGPTKTHLYLSDSATDWGQELKWTKQYLDAHNIRDCWFAYFPGPFLLPSDYGIPCKLLPTADTHGEMEIYVPLTIHGPVLISYADLNGFEFGTKVRNPYQSFFERQPDAVIANGIAVFNGDFTVPQVASLLPVWKSQTLLMKNNPTDALKEALAALAIDPRNFDGQIAAGEALYELNRDAEAREHYARAMDLVKTMEPSSQNEWSTRIKRKLTD
jgi:4-amino-4-deoxy-L-arabinose transferase-like glycosyltransferase